MAENNKGCKDCAERHAGCHCTCERYKQYKEERTARRKQIAEARSDGVEWDHYRKEHRNHWRVKRGMRKHGM